MLNGADKHFSDVEIETEVITKNCCFNCKWFKEDYPNLDYGICMFNPPIAIIMHDMIDKEIIRTVYPSPKYPIIDYCSKHERKDVP